MPFLSSPRSIAIIGKGDSELLYRFGDRPKTDEAWGINDIGLIYPELDKLWVMDDLKHHPKPDYVTDYYKNCKTPIITSKSYEEFPTSVDFPLQEVREYLCNYDITQHMFASTIAYMLIYAEIIGVMEIYFYGVDFAENNQDLTLATAFCLGRLAQKGVVIKLPKESKILNLHRNFYGYIEENNNAY